MSQHLALRQHSMRVTPQSEPIPGSTQEQNEAGGFAWQVDRWQRLHRFLILGSEGGTYYTSERKLTTQSANVIRECLAEDGRRVVREVIEVSTAGRAAKNDPAIFALAAAAKLGDEATRSAAFDALPEICRIGTHLFHFAAYVELFGGWGRGTRHAIARWYGRDVGDVAYQAVKYRQRDGWSHRDLLRLSHPKPPTGEHGALYRWITQGEVLGGVGEVVAAHLRVQEATTPDQVVAELKRCPDLPREALPTWALTEPKVWEAMLPNMPIGALTRNLANMTRIGLLTPTSTATRTVIHALGDGERIRKARLHPIAVLAALTTYASGQGARGGGEWSPVAQIVDALDAAFYAAFGSVDPTGKRIMLALDVSGSMSWGSVAGVPGLTPRVGAAAMALVTAATESAYEVVAFTTGLTALPLSSRERLDDVVRRTSQMPFGGTDCALPMIYATEQGREVDAFVIYTDNETWAGRIHPVQALTEYRRASGIDARLAVVGMEGNDFSIADPNDPGMLDLVGFDTAAPQVLAQFIAGQL